MKEWVHNSYISFAPNEYYYDVDSIGKGVKFVLMDDHNAMYSAYRNGELDFIQEVPLDETQALLDSGELIIDPYVGTYYISYQNEKAPFDDPRVRKAFTLAIDRDYIVETVTKRGEVPASAFVPYGIADAAGAEGDDFRTVGGDYYDVTGGEEAYAANCEEAKRLLAEAGYPDGEGFPTVEYLYNTSDAHKAIAEALQFMWEDVLGVTVTIDNQEWAVFLATRREGNYLVARNGWIADYNDPITMLDMWVTGGGNNNVFFSNEEYDSLIAKAKATSDPEERMEAMHAAEAILMDEMGVGPIYFYTNRHMLSPNVEGVFYTPLGYYFFHYATK
jgi:oligopeptide transport system substrate-binding protein